MHEYPAIGVGVECLLARTNPGALAHLITGGKSRPRHDRPVAQQSIRNRLMPHMNQAKPNGINDYDMPDIGQPHEATHGLLSVLWADSECIHGR